MDIYRQARAPFAEALEQYCRQEMIPFHTPGHKLGAGASLYQRELFGNALRRDLGVMYALDDLFCPEGPLKEAMDLAADLYGAGKTFFSVNGTTACIEAMILALCRQGDTVIIPREAHRSVLGGLILSGAVPIYMKSRFSAVHQVALGPDLAGLKEAIDAHPEAKAVLFTYPTYDGIAVDLPELAAYAHERGLLVLVDEAHGAHLPFHDSLPREALACGADCVAQSTHKLAGSLTQTSMLHCRRGFPYMEQIAAAMALVQSTSPHYWFLASLDSARQQLALHGRKLVGTAVALSRQLREDINSIPGLRSFGRELCTQAGVAGLDETKLTIDFAGIGYDGQQAERLLRREGIEVELTAGSHVLALMTLGDTPRSAAALAAACRRIAAGRRVQADTVHRELPLPPPCVAVSPRQAWNAPVCTVPLEQAAGCIAAETVTFYPPGVPVLSPGEVMTTACLAYIRQKMDSGYAPNGPADPSLRTLRVLQDDSGKPMNTERKG